MALVQMDPSKEGTIYKILVANPILNTPKNNKMFGLWRKCEDMWRNGGNIRNAASKSQKGGMMRKLLGKAPRCSIVNALESWKLELFGGGHRITLYCASTKYPSLLYWSLGILAVAHIYRAFAAQKKHHPQTFAVQVASGIANVKGINASGSIPCAASSRNTWVNQPLCSCCFGRGQKKTDDLEGLLKQRKNLNGIATSARGMKKGFCTTNFSIGMHVCP